MWQTPLSIVSSNSTPRDSSSARAAATSSTCSASGAGLELNGMFSPGQLISAIVTVPVSNSAPTAASPGRCQTLEASRPSTFS
jgi:hypothetical protein